MKKNPASQSGIFNVRIVIGVVLCSLSASLGWLSFAAPIPPGGTLTSGSGPLIYTDGPFVVANATAQANGAPICSPNPGGQTCSDFNLTINPAGMNPATQNVKIKVEWPVSAADFDVYVLDGVTQAVITTAASSSDPEICFLSIPASTHSYIVRTVPFAPAGQSYTGTISVESLPPPPPPPPPGTTAPRYQNYPPNPSTLGLSAGEPSIGVDWNPNVAALKHGTVNTGGVAFFTAGLEELRVSFDDCSSPAKNPNPPISPNTNAPLWEDVTFPTSGTVSLDPIGFVDHQYPGEAGTGYPPPSAQLGRVFVSQLAGATSSTVFSDTDGNSWTQSQGSGQPAGVDHQTIGGGPYNNASLPPPPPHPLYPHQIYYASQDIGTAFAARSDNGGQTFGPGVPMWNLTQCGGLHGHVKVGPDGTVYVPNRGCGGGQGVAVSTDNGLTWTVKTVPGSTPGDTDPSVGIGSDNTLYLGYASGNGTPHVATSTNHGDTWIDSEVSSGFIKNTVFPEMVAGDGTRAAFGFLGTTTGNTPFNYQDINNFRGVWYFYIATTFDRGNTWVLVNATGNDPVQIGSICTGGTTCGDDRNLLDFNDLQIDSEGRVLAGYADGCVAPSCTAETATAQSPPYTESRNALASILRQSGGPRLLSAFDSQANCAGNPPSCTATAPRPPRVDSVTGSAGVNVHIDWSEPDNGGSPLTGYKIYRRTDPGIYGAAIATVTTGCPACKSDYDDATTLPNTVYFYKVTALNAQGESTNCEEYSIGKVGPVELACLLPGLTILTDGTNDNLDAGAPPPNAAPAHDVQKLSIAEPAGFAPNKLVFTLKVQSLATVPPDTHWPVQFNNGATTYTVRMSTFPPSTPATPRFEYFQGALNTAMPTATAADPASTYSPDGKITIVIPRSGIGNPGVGATLTQFLSRIQVSAGAATLTPDNMPDSLAPSGSYTIMGNNPCNNAPVAALGASPLSGEPPLVVNFNASGSTDPDAGDTIVSYTFDFGDGTAPVTQASPLIAHTYTSNGHFHATVRVTDNHGSPSNNIAGVEIDVELPLDRVVSRKAHNGAAGGPFEVILFDPSVYPNGTGEIECRAPGPPNDYTIIYTFGTEFTVTGPASSVTVDGAGTYVSSHMAGPGTNQYTVHVSPTVPNAKHHTITIDGVPVTNSNQGNAPATLKNAIARFDLLVGDTSGIGNGLVNSTDVSQTQAESGHPITNGPTGNFRTDVTANGEINSSDVSTVQGQSGTGISGGVSPPPSKPGPQAMPRSGRK